MGRFLGGIFSNDSVFGQIMTRVGILVGANLMFVLFAFPLVTTGPALTALFYVMLKVLRGEHELNPFKTFFRGFISNFKQAIICWLVYMAIMAVAYLDYRFLKTMGGPADILKFAVAAVAIAVTVVMLFLPPVMAAFADTIPNLLRNAVFFAVKNPLRLIAVAAIVGIPGVITFLHIRYQPLYAFIWFFFGFSAVAMACSAMLIRDFEKYLPAREEELSPDDQAPYGGDGISGQGKVRSDRKTLGEMKKLDM